MNWVLTEYDEEKHIANEKRWSLEEGEDRMSRLFSILLEQNRQDDMIRCLTDKEFRKELMQELFI